jgi:hypothetical protein
LLQTGKVVGKARIGWVICCLGIALSDELRIDKDSIGVNVAE